MSVLTDNLRDQFEATFLTIVKTSLTSVTVQGVSEYLSGRVFSNSDTLGPNPKFKLSF